MYTIRYAKEKCIEALRYDGLVKGDVIELILMLKSDQAFDYCLFYSILFPLWYFWFGDKLLKCR